VPKPLDRVQLQKQENVAQGGSSDDFDDWLYSPLDPMEDAPEVGGLFIQESGIRDETVTIYRENGELYFEDLENSGLDRLSLSDLAELGSGVSITEHVHKELHQLIHFLDDGPGDEFATTCYKQIDGQPFPTKITWYTDEAHHYKLFEKEIGRTPPSGTVVKPNPVRYRIYDTDGSTVLDETIDEITYSGIFEVSRKRSYV
jgi:hypothetical protein